MTEPSRKVETLLVITTGDDSEKLNRLAKLAIEKRLAACAQISGPVTSHYRWENQLQSDQEWRCLFKTTAERFPELRSMILEQHHYENPQIVAVDLVDGHNAYLEWIHQEVAPQQDSHV